MAKKTRVFISYAHQDQPIAYKIANRLQAQEIDVFAGEKELQAGGLFIDKLKYIYESSDVILILLTKNSLNSSKFSSELDNYILEAKRRKIYIIPVIIEHCAIPSSLMSFLIYDISNDFNTGIERLVTKVVNLNKVSFEDFDLTRFNDFTHDLLLEYGFKNIERKIENTDNGFDFICEYPTHSPFGRTINEIWLVETKFYKQSRFSISEIQKLLGANYFNGQINHSLLLVTNALLTSVVESYLNNIKTTNKIPIEILDGSAIEKIAIEKQNLFDKYFSA